MPPCSMACMRIGLSSISAPSPMLQLRVASRGRRPPMASPTCPSFFARRRRRTRNPLSPLAPPQEDGSDYRSVKRGGANMKLFVTAAAHGAFADLGATGEAVQ